MSATSSSSVQGCCVCIFISSVMSIVILAIVANAPFHARNGHHTLQDLIISDINITDLLPDSKGNNAALLTCRVKFKVEAVNGNKKLGFLYRHFRLAVSYGGIELGRGYVPRVMQGPRNTSIYEPEFRSENISLNAEDLKSFRSYLSAGFVQLKLGVKIRAKRRLPYSSWKNRFASRDMEANDGCRLNVSTGGSSSHLHGRACRWKLQEKSTN